MSEEIKEIEQYLKKCSNCFTCNNFLGEDENGGHCMLQNAFNHITNLQNKLETERKTTQLLTDDLANITEIALKKENIIKEVREYIESYMPNYDFDKTNLIKLLEILKGENND